MGNRVHICLFQCVSCFLAHRWEYQDLTEHLGNSKSTPKRPCCSCWVFRPWRKVGRGLFFYVTATRTPAIRLFAISISPPWLCTDICQTLWLIKADCWQLSFKWRRTSLSHSGLILWKRQKRLWSFALMKVTSHVEDQRGICSLPASNSNGCAPSLCLPSISIFTSIIHPPVSLF